jgi:hypothetical protein
MMTTQPVFVIKAANEQDEMEFQVLSSNTLYQIMAFCCSEWLNKIIGEIDGHVWRMYRRDKNELPFPLPARYDDEDKFERTEEEYFAASDKQENGLPVTRTYGELFSNIGDANTHLVHVEYDYGSTMEFWLLEHSAPAV